MQFDAINEEMLQAVIESLPGEITVIDAKDEVVGWNKHEERLFRRPLSCMGLNVRQCHPQDSMAMVEEILMEMRAGTREVARFWLDMPVPEDAKPHKILIEFYALRNPAGQYLGCMEHALDVQYIRDLTGQKRLLD
jgi:DUF438 domain-containing protein